MASFNEATMVMLRAHPSISHDAPRNKFVCAITQHEMPADELALRQYIAGRKYKSAKAWKTFIETEKQWPAASQYVVTHKSKPGLLYCKLTHREVPRIPETILNHISSKKFLRKLLELKDRQAKAAARAEKHKIPEGADGFVIPGEEEDDDIDVSGSEDEEEDDNHAQQQRKRRRTDDVDFPVIKKTADDVSDAESADDNPYGDDDEEEEEEGGDDEDADFEEDDEEEPEPPKKNGHKHSKSNSDGKGAAHGGAGTSKKNVSLEKPASGHKRGREDFNSKDKKKG